MYLGAFFFLIQSILNLPTIYPLKRNIRFNLNSISFHYDLSTHFKRQLSLFVEVFDSGADGKGFDGRPSSR